MFFWSASATFGRLSGADPGFVVRGGVSRRGVWGPLKVPSWSRAEPWKGAVAILKIR
jgi:hypothetical protein